MIKRSEGVIEALVSMDPYRFEQFVADLWERRGWRTEVSSESRDAGIDITARKYNPFEQTQILQAKRYTSGNKVNSSEVQQYASLRQQVPDADSVIIVTTSEFTRDAQERASELNVKLVGGEELVQLVQSQDAYDLLDEAKPVTEADTDSESAEVEIPASQDEAVEVDGVEEMSTSEAVIAVIQGLVALVILISIAFLILQALVL